MKSFAKLAVVMMMASLVVVAGCDKMKAGEQAQQPAPAAEASAAAPAADQQAQQAAPAAEASAAAPAQQAAH